MTPATPDGLERNNLTGGAWLLTDMVLNVSALSIVKTLGLGYPAAQIVFFRALVGFLLMLPWIWHARARFVGIADLPLHALRVALSVIALSASYYAIARLPLALFTALGFTRPLVTMLLAALLLHERIRGRHWLAAGVALAGVVVAVGPGTGGVQFLDPAVLAACATVLAGSAAVIAIRRLRAAPQVALMAFYTGGLTLASAPLALTSWHPVATAHLPALIAIGVFAQCGQFCFLRAHFWGDAAVLSVLSYLSLILSTVVGLVVFAEIPRPAFWAGAALVVGAALSVSRLGWSARRVPGPR